MSIDTVVLCVVLIVAIFLFGYAVFGCLISLHRQSDMTKVLTKKTLRMITGTKTRRGRS